MNEMIVLVKYRLLEITEELQRARIREKRLAKNIQMMKEVKPW